MAASVFNCSMRKEVFSCCFLITRTRVLNPGLTYWLSFFWNAINNPSFPTQRMRDYFTDIWCVKEFFCQPLNDHKLAYGYLFHSVWYPSKPHYGRIAFVLIQKQHKSFCIQVWDTSIGMKQIAICLLLGLSNSINLDYGTPGKVRAKRSWKTT